MVYTQFDPRHRVAEKSIKKKAKVLPPTPTPQAVLDQDDKIVPGLDSPVPEEQEAEMTPTFHDVQAATACIM
jgi:hypothetical protein